MNSLFQPKHKLNNNSATTNYNPHSLIKHVSRTSSLLAPIMLLSAHHDQVLSIQFSPDSSIIASCSFDKTICLWNASHDCKHTQTISGHSGAILQLKWSRDASLIYSCSSDKSVAIFDVQSGKRIKNLKSHSSIVNSISNTLRGPELISSASDDGLIKIWDPRSKHPVKSLNNIYPVLSVSFNLEGNTLFSAGIDNEIKAWDLRKDDVSYSLVGHTDSVTGLSLSPNGNSLLSYSMDSTLKTWDIKPFSNLQDRLENTFHGAPHGFEKNLIRPCWSPDADFVAVGSGDRSVVIWNTSTGKIAYKLPGHKGCVNEVDWRGSVIASCSSDRTIYLGELDVNEVK